MPYKTGSWGIQAKERSKRRLEYFRNRPKRKYVYRNRLGRGISLELISKATQRVNGLCENCGEKGYLIHHKNGKHKDNRLENLQFLCQRCHPLIHAKYRRDQRKN